MSKENQKSSTDRFNFYYAEYVHGKGIYIVAVENGEEYEDVTINLTDYYLADSKQNLVFIPSTINPAVYEQFKRQFVDEELLTVPYGNFDSTAKLVHLKPNWKESCNHL